MGRVAGWAVAALLLAVSVLVPTPAPSPAVPPPVPGPGVAGTSLLYVNAGQIGDPSVLFAGTRGDLAAGFETGAVRVLAGAPSGGRTELRISFPGARPVAPAGADPAGPPANFFLGSDPARWRAGVPGYREVRYAGLYDGIDLVYRLTAGGLKYDVVVAAGADLSRVRIAYEGVRSLRLGPDGSLVLSTAAGDLRDSAPVAVQGGLPASCRFALRGPTTVGFSCEGRDPSRPLTIDPLVFGTFLGGSGRDEIRGLALGPSGDAYVTGVTASTDFPATPGAYANASRGGSDVFVARLAANGTRFVYATFVGGRDEEEGYAIAVDAQGRAVVTGYTLSADFPVVAPALDPASAGGDGFLVRLSPGGDALEVSTYIGGSNFDEATALALGADGSAYLVGETLSSDFPTTPGAFDRSNRGGWDAFVAKVDPSGTRLVYGTYLAGVFYDAANGVAVDSAGSAVVVGTTLSTDFPTTPGAFQTLLRGAGDAFVTRVLSDGSGLVSSTFIGGGSTDQARAVVLDADGNAHVAGTTDSLSFPVTSDAGLRTPSGGTDSFYTVLDPSGGTLEYSTYLGGLGDDEARSLALHPAGGAVIAGMTDSPDFPLSDHPFDTSLGDPSDAFVTWIGGPGPALTYSTFLGGVGSDGAYGVAVAPGGDVVVAGVAGGQGFPSTPDAADPTWNGVLDGFVVRMDVYPETGPAVQVLGLALVALIGVILPLAFIVLARRRRREPPPPPRPTT